MRRQLTASAEPSTRVRARKRREPSGARSSRLLGVALVTTALLLALASTALASRTYQSQVTGLTTPFGVETDSGGNMWVSDTGTSTVSKFDPSGTLQASNDGTGLWGTSTFVQDLAFGQTAGVMYALDSNFDDIWGLNSSNATSAGVDLHGGTWDTGDHNGCCFVSGAVDNTGGAFDGDLYIASQVPKDVVSRVDGTGAAVNFSASQSYISGNQITGTPDHAFSLPVDVAFDGNGDFYVVDQGLREVDRYDSTGTFVRSYTTPAGVYTGVAIDPTTGDVLIADNADQRVYEFDSSGTLLDQIGGLATPAGSFTPQGIATDASGKLYVTDKANGVVDVFGPDQDNLTVNCDGTGSGAVGPVACGATQAENAGSSVILTATPAAGSTFTGWSGGGCSGTGTCNVTLNADTAVTATFAQNAPTVVTGAASGVSQTGATVGGTVNPNGANVANCHVEFGTSTAYGSQVACSSLPGAGSSAVAVQATLSGLAAGTTYHFRVVATNPGGPSNGADASFTTSPKSTPPPPPPPTCQTNPSLCPAKSSTLKLSSATASVTSGKAAVKLFCNGTATCSGKVKLTAKLKVRKGHKTKTVTVTIGSATIRVKPGGRVTVNVRLNRAALNVLASKHSLKATITGPDKLKHAIVLKEKPKKKKHKK